MGRPLTLSVSAESVSVEYIKPLHLSAKSILANLFLGTTTLSIVSFNSSTVEKTLSSSSIIKSSNATLVTQSTREPSTTGKSSTSLRKIS